MFIVIENDTEMSETDPFYSEEADGMSKRTQLEEYFSQSLEIRHAAIDAARSIRSRRKREISLEYLIEEKHYPFSTTDKYFAEQSGMTSYPLFVCGQMVLLESPELAAALSALSQMEQEIIFLYYFQRLTHREIGRRYGRAGNTTGRRIQMILRRLRAELEGLSYEPATSL